VGLIRKDTSVTGQVNVETDNKENDYFVENQAIALGS